ncbi:hypothetical protein [Nostoc commune]|uniref:hypothetical protein n=1 Tax=Nostoc commune TaxID=1178 RepID=UPI0018C5F3FD|nr:hypothetical protein [Nostoc commune]MBG1260441.1 hypothetical protein [Nostoc commune BAE]
MKINWFSPIFPENTYINSYTNFVFSNLTKNAEVTVWTNQKECQHEIYKYTCLRKYDLNDIPWSDINQADLNIYHIDNDANFYYGIWSISCQCPGLIVLHNIKLHNFFLKIYKEKEANQYAYFLQMQKYYGYEGRKSAEMLWNQNVLSEDIQFNYPLTFLALENALCVIVHTQEALNYVQKEKKFCVNYLPISDLNQWETKISNESEIYTQFILECGKKIRSLRHRLIAHQLTQKVGEHVSFWSKPDMSDVEIKRIAEAIYFISA